MLAVIVKESDACPFPTTLQRQMFMVEAAYGPCRRESALSQQFRVEKTVISNVNQMPFVSQVAF